ncbi:MAG: hypothetical protein IJE77_12675 [Thermoguttaceae bacterium]|nr:hypothetical protein [Thermoguttaceae bacterium]MBQ9801224.1 hypothetical protein [Thermoguttaceae bacterium]
MKKTRKLSGLTFGAGLLALCAVCGCSEPIPVPGEDAESTQEAAATTSETSADAATAGQADAAETTAEPEAEYVEKKADVGATGKGEYGVTSEEPMSIVTVPVSTYFKAQEMAVFRMQIPSAMNLFQASEGRYPNSEEEFMTKIIKANQIVLPKLPEGDVYFYDVQARELKIRSKKAN